MGKTREKLVIIAHDIKEHLESQSRKSFSLGRLDACNREAARDRHVSCYTHAERVALRRACPDSLAAHTARVVMQTLHHPPFDKSREAKRGLNKIPGTDQPRRETLEENPVWSRRATRRARETGGRAGGLSSIFSYLNHIPRAGEEKLNSRVTDDGGRSGIHQTPFRWARVD